MNRKRWLLPVVSILVGVIIWNYPLTYRVGINGVVFERRIPFYAKISSFLYRDWMYKDIVASIVNRKDDDLKKVLDILRWTNENIMYGIPAGLKVVDDHPLNIIIRQYGAKDQVEDVFTILCAYAGLEAGMHRCDNADKTRTTVFSFVRVKGRWLIFDAARDRYFFNKDGEIGSVEDYLNERIVLSDEDRDRYKEFLDDLKNIDFSSFSRAKEQMPLKRLPIQLKKIFRSKG